MSPMLSTALLRTQSDRRLATLAGAGHERAFEALSERYRRELWRHCRRLLDEGHAEDAVQQAFLQAWVALRSGARVDEMRAWLHRIAHHAAIDTLRRAGAGESPLGEQVASAADPAQDAERRDLVRRTLAGVAALPARQRMALLATAVGGREQVELAREMGVSHGAVRQLVHAARTTLRSAVTAITPTPVTTWLATRAASDGSPLRPAVEVAGGAGGPGLAGILVKAGAGAAVAASVASAGPVVVGAGTHPAAARGTRTAAAGLVALGRHPSQPPGGAASGAGVSGRDSLLPGPQPTTGHARDRGRAGVRVWARAAPWLLPPTRPIHTPPPSRWARPEPWLPGSWRRPEPLRPGSLPGRTGAQHPGPGQPSPYQGKGHPEPPHGSSAPGPSGDHRPGSASGPIGQAPAPPSPGDGRTSSGSGQGPSVAGNGAGGPSGTASSAEPAPSSNPVMTGGTQTSAATDSRSPQSGSTTPRASLSDHYSGAGPTSAATGDATGPLTR